MTVATIDQLAELQVRRLGYIRAVNRIDNAAAALVRRQLGWRYDTAEEERGKLNKRAKTIVSIAYAGKAPTKDDQPILAMLAADLENYRLARAPFVKARSEIEKAMRKLAHQLPAWPWVESVRGFGDLAFSVIVAEAGDLANYPDRHRLWKRFGLTPHEGQAASTWRRKGGLDAAGWEALGYKPTRNAESYAVLGDPLFRQQTMIGGPYRAVYDREKARFLQAEKTKMHSHMHGLRCMRKAAIEDLWRAWNGHPSKERVGVDHGKHTNGQREAIHAGAAEMPTAA